MYACFNADLTGLVPFGVRFRLMPHLSHTGVGVVMSLEGFLEVRDRDVLCRHVVDDVEVLRCLCRLDDVVGRASSLLHSSAMGAVAPLGFLQHLLRAKLRVLLRGHGEELPALVV